MLPDLVTKVRSYLPEADTAVLERAYRFSEHAHADQRRASGEHFFSHSRAVAEKLTELKLDTAAISAALLHDVLEDTTVSRDELLREFGPEITLLVDGVTKIDSYRFGDPETAQAENWRKMILAVARDFRVILIKLADRIHNLRTIEFLEQDKQQAIARESLNLYAPFAERLGLTHWRGELEDLSFKVLDPEACDRVYKAAERSREHNVQVIEHWQVLLTERLAPSGIPFRLVARKKNLYSIFRKMQRQGKEIAQIQDVIGLRLITDTVANCYALLGLVHDHFQQVPDTFTDYISVPNNNLYQSIHTTIRDDEGLSAEIQIRTEDMHRKAEYGIAAHWLYKEHGGKKHGGTRSAHTDETLDWLKHVLEWQQELKDPREFLSALMTAIEFEQVFVFTPKGKVIKLPPGATPVDFAYAVHSEIGRHCYGAKVGNKLVPLSYQLKSGEICEILTRKNSNPSKHWMEFVRTPLARSRIRKHLRENEHT